jgi:hypothetical protein
MIYRSVPSEARHGPPFSNALEEVKERVRHGKQTSYVSQLPHGYGVAECS